MTVSLSINSGDLPKYIHASCSCPKVNSTSASRLGSKSLTVKSGLLGTLGRDSLQHLTLRFHRLFLPTLGCLL